MDTQDQIERFISHYWAENWTSPSVREIADHVGYRSKSSAHRLLTQMVDSGRLQVRRIGKYRVYYRVAP